MNLFFILMLVIMGSRTIYYLLMHFNFEKGIVDKPVDNAYLIGIYFQEIVFNFVVFYNLILKQSHQEKHFEPQYRRATTHQIKNSRAIATVAVDGNADESITEK